MYWTAGSAVGPACLDQGALPARPAMLLQLLQLLLSDLEYFHQQIRPTEQICCFPGVTPCHSFADACWGCPLLQAAGCFANRVTSVAVIGCSQSGKTFAINKLLAAGVLRAKHLHEQQVQEQQLDSVEGLPDNYKSR